MMIDLAPRSLLRVAKLLMLPVLLAVAMSAGARAADEKFVGLLADLATDDVAKELKLTDEQRQQLLDLIIAREDEALELVIQIKELPIAEQEARLKPFRRESEKQGLALLSDAQRSDVEKLRLSRHGLAALADDSVRDKLELTADQRTAVDEILESRGAAIQKAGDNDKQRRNVQMYYDRRLSGVLTEAQKKSWQTMTGEDAVADAKSAADDEPAVKKEPPAVGKEDPPGAAAKDPPIVKSPLKSPVKDPSKKPARPPQLDEPPPADGKLRFTWEDAEWDSVLKWFARQADLSLVADKLPPGTFSYRDRGRTYTPTEALDVLNSQLLTRNFTLVRREKQITLIDLKDGIPPNLIPEVTPDQLAERGQFELVRVRFPVQKLTPTEAESEIARLLGPQGAVVVLSMARQIHVTEVAGRMRTIASVISAIENPPPAGGGKLHKLPLEHITADEALGVVRQLIGMEADRNSLSDGSLRIAVDALGANLLATGTDERISELKEVIKLVDVPLAELAVGGAPAAPPVLRVYGINTADPEAVLQVLRTLLAGLPDVRLAVDAKTGRLIAQARPAQHDLIRGTIEQMEGDGSQIEVIQLRRVDPQLAVLLINKLFGGDQQGATGAPKVDVEPTTGQLLIRGSKDQIEQIRTMLEKMGETGEGASPLVGTSGGRVRMIPLTGSAGRTALEQLQQIWPGVRGNRIRIVTPSSVISTLQSGGSLNGIREVRPAPDEPESKPGPSPPPPGPPPPGPSPLDGPFNPKLVPGTTPPVPKAAPPAEKRLPQDKSTSRPAARRPRVVLVSQPAQPAGGDSTPKGDPAPKTPPPVKAKGEPGKAAPTGAADKVDQKQGPLAPIIVAPGPGGIMIASEDEAALDEFESLLQTLSSRTFAGGSQYTVFYLKHAEAPAVAELLNEIFGTGGGGGGGGGGSLFGDLARSALGDAGGGLVGGLLGLGGDGGDTGAAGGIQIVAEPRLNALIVQASPNDQDTIEQLLRVIDQRSSPEDVAVSARPRMIPVINTSAAEIMGVVQEVYRDRLLTTAGSAQRQPSPEQFIQMLRGGRGNRRNSRSQAESTAQKMKIGIDQRTNSLIVVAPDPLFEEVEMLVAQLDRATGESNETMRVVTIHRANPATIQRALSAIVGQTVRTSRTPTTPSSTTPQNTGSPPSPGGRAPTQQPSPEQIQNDIQRRLEFFRQFRGGNSGDRGGGTGRGSSGFGGRDSSRRRGR